MDSRKHVPTVSHLIPVPLRVKKLMRMTASAQARSLQPARRVQKQGRMARVRALISRRDQIVVFLGVVLVFGSFIVKDHKLEKAKDALSAVHSAETTFELHGDIMSIKSELNTSMMAVRTSLASLEGVSAPFTVSAQTYMYNEIVTAMFDASQAVIDDADASVRATANVLNEFTPEGRHKVDKLRIDCIRVLGLVRDTERRIRESWADALKRIGQYDRNEIEKHSSELTDAYFRATNAVIHTNILWSRMRGLEWVVLQEEKIVAERRKAEYEKWEWWSDVLYVVISLLGLVRLWVRPQTAGAASE